MNFRRDMLLLYAVTDRKWVGRQTLFEQIEDSLRGGVTMVQLREKELDLDSFAEEAIQVRELCHSYGVPLIINDRLDVALKSGADGVHVGVTDSPVSEIRRIVGREFIIGATAKTIEQAISAQTAGADYIGVGAVFPSPTKKNAIRITREQLADITSSVDIPAVAIGGIDRTNISEIAGSGITGVAVVSAIFSAEDIRAASAELKAMSKSVAG